MKKYVLLLFFFVPHLIYASFETHACTKALEKVDAEWAAHHAYLLKFEAVSQAEKMQSVPMLQEALECCHRAIGHCDYILKKIEQKSKRERQQHYWSHVRKECKQYKTVFFAEIERLNGAISSIFTEIAARKASALFHTGAEKLQSANEMRKNDPTRQESAESTVAALKEAIQSYQDASLFFAQALEAIAQYPLEDVKSLIQQALDVCSTAIEECDKEIAQRELESVS